MYQLFNVFLDVIETLHIDSLKDSNMCLDSKFERAYYAPGGALVLFGFLYV